MDDLPPDIATRIFAMLPQRAASALACTSRAMRAAYDDVPKAVVMHNADAGSAARFLARQGETIYKLRSSNEVLNACAPAVVPCLSRLRHLKLGWSVVPDSALAMLPPCLETLHVRRLAPALASRRRPRAFSTGAALDRLSALRHVALWFAASYDIVRVDHAARYATLCLVVPTYVEVVGEPPAPATSLRLDALAVWTAGARGRLALAPRTRLRTSEFAIPREAFAAASFPGVVSLAYACPSRTWIPHLAAMINLRRLVVTVDYAIARLRDFENLDCLESLEIRARVYASVAGAFAGFDRGVAVDVFVSGARSAFHSEALMAPT